MQTITAKIPAEMYDKVSAVAEETDRTRSYVVRKALESFLDNKQAVSVDETVNYNHEIPQDNYNISFDDMIRRYGLQSEMAAA